MGDDWAASALGTTTLLDHFVLVAEQITALMVGGTAIPLTPGASNTDVPFGATGDLGVREV